MDRDVGSPAQAGLTPQPPLKSAGSGLLEAGAEFVGNAGLTLVGAIVGAVLTMCSEVLAARFLGVAGYGLYALALMLAKVGAVIVVVGLPIGILHYLPIHLSRNEPQRALGTILGSIPLPLAMGLMLAVGLGIGGHWVAAHVLGQPGAGGFLAVLGLVIPLLVMIDLLGSTARGFGLALPAVVIQNMVPPLCAIPVLVLLMLWSGPQIGVAYAQVVGLIVGASLGIWFVARLVRERIGPARPTFELGRLYGYALPITLNVVATLVIGFTDLYLLGVLRDAGTVGTYRACMQIVILFGLPMNAMRAATAPVYTVLIAEGRRAALQDTYAASVRLATLMALPLLLIIVVNGGDLLGIMGPAFTAGSSALLVLACGQSVESGFSSAHVVLIIGERQRLEAGNMALAAGLNLVLNLVLIPPYGLLGAALSTATSLIALAVLRGLQLRRILALRTIDRPLLRIVLVCVPPALLIWAASLPLGLGPGSGIGPLVLRLVVMAAAIGGAVWWFCFNAQDRAMVRRFVSRHHSGPVQPVTVAPTTAPFSGPPIRIKSMLRTFFPRAGNLADRPPPLDAPYVGQLQALPSELVFIMGCHRSGTSMLYHLLSYTGQVDYVSAYDIVEYDELLYNRATGRETQVKADLDRLLRREATRGLDQLPARADVPEEYRFLMHQEKRAAALSFQNRLETLFFAPHLTPSTLDAFLDVCRKKRFLADDDRPLVLKNPTDYYFNFWNVHEMLPQAKFIFIHRHPLPMINSFLHSFPAQLTEYSNYAALIDSGYHGLFSRTSLRRQLLLREFRSNRMCRLLITRLVQSFEYYVAHVHRLPPQQYVSVRYEDLCDDPAACLSEIGAHLRLNLAPRIPPRFVAPRHLPILDRVTRNYAARLADMTPYLQSCHYAAWPDLDEAAPGKGAESSKWIDKQQQPAG